MALFVAWPKAGTVLEVLSAVLGILGTCLMSQQYAPQLRRSVFYAAAWPFLALTGRAQRWHTFLGAKASVNWDVPQSAEKMAIGLNLLFWAFFCQLAAILLS